MTASMTASSPRPPALRIDPLYQSLLPPLDADSLRYLEESLLSEGCRFPILVWPQSAGSGGAIIVDGHYRYAICRKHGISFSTSAICFSSRDHACSWIVRHHLGRRNLTPSQRALLAARVWLAPSAEDGGGQQSQAGAESRPPAPAGQSLTDLADSFQVSERSIQRAVSVLRNGPQEIADDIASGQLTVRAAADRPARPKAGPGPGNETAPSGAAIEELFARLVRALDGRFAVYSQHANLYRLCVAKLKTAHEAWRIWQRAAGKAAPGP